MPRLNCRAWDPYAATRLRPHEAWQILMDVIQGDRVINPDSRRPIVGVLDQATLDFLKDWLGIDAPDGNEVCNPIL